jgi:hypothetical protein
VQVVWFRQFGGTIIALFVLAALAGGRDAGRARGRAGQPVVPIWHHRRCPSCSEGPPRLVERGAGYLREPAGHAVVAICHHRACPSRPARVSACLLHARQCAPGLYYSTYHLMSPTRVLRGAVEVGDMGLSREDACPPTRARSGARSGGHSVRRNRADGTATCVGVRGSAGAAKRRVHVSMMTSERTLCAHHPGAHLLVCGAYQQARTRTPTAGEPVVDGHSGRCAHHGVRPAGHRRRARLRGRRTNDYSTHPSGWFATAC